jgi:glutamate/tyrosine decarboxylase-like PLP-dependent enzyme
VSRNQLTFGVDTAYVPERAEGRVYPYISSMQWSRRFMGLKVFMMFAARGLPEIARRIEHQTAMGDLLRERLEGCGWTIVNDTALPVICFTHARIAADPSSAAAVVRRLKESQEAWISKTDLPGRLRVLRACITNFNTQPEHIDRLVGLLERELHRLNDPVPR